MSNGFIEIKNVTINKNETKKTDDKKTNDKKSETKTDKNPNIKQETPFLTSQNWTPDIVGTMLGTMFGLTLGMTFSFLDIIPLIQAKIFGAILALVSAYWFSRLCVHMELKGKRYFQQTYVLIIPMVVIYATNGVIIYMTKLFTQNLAIPTPLSNISIGSQINSFLPAISFNTIFIWSGIYSIAVLIPFIIYSAKQKELRFSYFIPFIILLTTGIGVYYGLTAMMR